MLDFEAEFERMGLEYHKTLSYDFPTPKVNENSKGFEWRMMFNRSRSGDALCPSYPWMLVVPYNLSEKIIHKTLQFRSKQRLPIMSYIWKHESLPKKYVTLWRSAQSLPGFGGNRSFEDEYFLFSLPDPTNTIDFEQMKREKSMDNSFRYKKNLHVFDCRPRSAAVGNKFMGKGYENTDHYENINLTFHDIQNAPSIGSAHKELNKCLISHDKDNWCDVLAGSNWVQYISRILLMVDTVLKDMKKGITSMVHCSDGWDRTAQVCSLIQIIIDPYYRTYKGFMVLVEKDWVAYGHQFKTRQGYLGSKGEDKERSPIFLQF
jgi:myotubularin